MNPIVDGKTSILMDAPFLQSVRHSIEGHEGRVGYAYQDHKGYWTIGIGHLIDERRGGKLPDHIIDLLCDWDIEQVITELDRNAPFWREVHKGARAALIEMGFQMGVPSLMKFRKMWAALKNGDYAEAHAQALQSKWARIDTPDRAKAVAAKFLETV